MHGKALMTTNHRTSKRRYWLAGNRDDGQDRFFREALDPEIWEAGDAEHWDACWYTGMPAPEVFERLTPHKWINHIPGNNGLTIKSRLAEGLSAAHAQMAAEEGPDGEGARRMAFFPDTYPMPRAYHDLQAVAHARPETRWILKPKNAARGEGISLVRDVAAVPSGEKWMVQRYLHEPHTMHGHKYVLRLYVLITSVEPLRVYLYWEGFAKLASEPYDLRRPDNIFSHLTNPDINATNVGAPAPVVFIPLADYRDWLRSEGHDDEALMARVRDLVTLTMIAARETMLRRLRGTRADTSGCYELLGLDCLVDSSLKPWIMECNLSPSLDICAAPKDGGDKEHVIKRQLVRDMVDMLGFNRPRPDRSDLDPATRILAETDEEMAHRGGWERIWPGARPEDHLSFFPLPRLADMVLADAVAGAPVRRPTVCAYRTSEVVGDDGMSVYAEETGTLHRLNATAAWIWLKATGGEDPDRIGEELAALRHPEGKADPWAARSQTWSQLADWAALRLLRKVNGVADVANRATRAEGGAQRIDAPDATAIAVRAGDAHVRIVPSSAPVRDRLTPFLNPIEIDSSDADVTLQVIESQGGYALALDSRLVATNLLLAGVAPAVCEALLGSAVGEEDAGALSGALLALCRAGSDEPVGIFVAPGEGGTWEAPAVELAWALGASLSCGLRIGAEPTELALPVGLPARIPESVYERLAEHGLSGEQRAAAEMRQIWPRGLHGHLLPLADGSTSRSVKVDAVVVPMSQRDDDGSEILRTLPLDAAVAVLLQGYRRPGGATPTARHVDTLARWLERRALWAVSVAEPRDAARALSQALGQDTAARLLTEL